MVDNEKRENLANARRQLKKFRDQHQSNSSETSVAEDVDSIHGTSINSSVNYNTVQPMVSGSGIPAGIHQNILKSPIAVSEEPNRQYVRPIENQSQQRCFRLEGQRSSTGTSSTSGRSNLSSADSEEKLCRDVNQLQEQLEIHVQTIGMLVAEKSDVSAKLGQSFKQLERKQGEMDELYGRLKASRERVQELEKQISNSTANLQKREMAAKEFDKENNRLKIENIRQSQSIEDLKQGINELNEKLHNRQTLVDQLTVQLEESKQQCQKPDETSVIEKQMNELKQTIEFKDSQIEEISSSINRMRSDNEQFQQYNTNMQNHIKELNRQIVQLTERNSFLLNENDAMKITYPMNSSDQCSLVDHTNLQQENNFYRNAVEQWSNRYEELKSKLLSEKDEIIVELKTNNNNDSNDQHPPREFQENFHQISNENINLKKQIEHLKEYQSNLNNEQQTQTDDQSMNLSLLKDIDDNNQVQQMNLDRVNETMRENIDLKARIEHLEHVIQQLQSETETIGDYIYLYQQQREQLQKRYEEKDIYIQQLTHDRMSLQKKVSEFEILFVQILSIPMTNLAQLEKSNTQMSLTQVNMNSSMELACNTKDNQEFRTVNHPLLLSSSTNNQIMSLHSDKPTDSRFSMLSEETKLRTFELIKELQQTNISPEQHDSSSSIKLAFVDSSLYTCSTCSGLIQSV
ncbi:unnamed protein product [Rotaria magnacalcarata]|uniref:Golgin subfamily A conserved domain-containing protein n=1 Tax=Rotaria magnacalcarata TaxID=392030 RepID=A0A8S2QA95_9BILA|nr:unnamed protein product [Rotaria magnacalcarata]CAF4092249.1 unnamed protein product [Rotaria magnacalcarata]